MSRAAHFRQVLKNLRRSRSATIGFTILILHIFVALLASVIAPYSPTDIDPLRSFQGPSFSHPFGSDQYGRDVLSRVIYGGRQALTFGISAAAIAVIIGGVVGLLMAYRGGFLDEIVLRVVDALLPIPGVLLLLVILTVFGSGRTVIVLAMALNYLPGAVRISRAAALDVTPREFVTAARARGERALPIVLREIRPNVMDVLLVEFAMRACWAILLISGLSFLGFGVNPPTPDWGLMIAENRAAMSIAPWATIFPIIALGSLVIAINLAADGFAKAIGIDLTRGGIH